MVPTYYQRISNKTRGGLFGDINASGGPLFEKSGAKTFYYSYKDIPPHILP